MSEESKIFSALEVPMREDESVDYEALEKLVLYEESNGIEGFYVGGSSGEGLLLTPDERKKILECVVRTVEQRVPVIAHVGTIRTQDVIELAKHAQSVGVDTVSMIPPYYYRFSMDEITSYYEDVIDAIPGIKVIVYNIPQFTGIEFNKDNAGRLLDNPAVTGIKHTSTNLYALERMKSAYPDKNYYNGFDEQFLGALSMGANATIGTTVNVFGSLFIKVRDAFQRENYKEAYHMQQEINLRVETMVSVGIFSAVKYALSLKGIPCGACRRPFHPLTEEEKDKIRKLMEG